MRYVTPILLEETVFLFELGAGVKQKLWPMTSLLAATAENRVILSRFEGLNNVPVQVISSGHVAEDELPL